VGRARGRNFDYVVAVYSPPGTDSPKQPYIFDNNVRKKFEENQNRRDFRGSIIGKTGRSTEEII
jgi:hypothetical protein